MFLRVARIEACIEWTGILTGEPRVYVEKGENMISADYLLKLGGLRCCVSILHKGSEADETEECSS